MTRPSHLLLAAGLLSLSAGAMAQPPGPLAPRGPDGASTRTEAQTRLEAAFVRRDSNKDGKIDAQDRAARQDQHRAMMFDRADADGNGSISKDEFAVLADKGQDRMAKRRSPMAEPGAMRGAMGPGGPQGSMTKSDFVARGLAMFDRIDADHDGTISAEERKAARLAMRDRFPRRMAPPPSAPPPSGQ